MRVLFYRIPQSLPSLHDEVLAAAANAAISISSDHMRKQVFFFYMIVVFSVLIHFNVQFRDTD